MKLVAPCVYCIAGNSRGRKLLQIGGKYDFHKENFCSLVLPKDTTPPNFVEKTFTNSHKTLKFAKVFSLETFSLYGILQSGTAIHVTAIEMDHNNCVMLTTFSQLVRADFIDNCVEL